MGTLFLTFYFFDKKSKKKVKIGKNKMLKKSKITSQKLIKKIVFFDKMRICNNSIINK